VTVTHPEWFDKSPHDGHNLSESKRERAVDVDEYLIDQCGFNWQAMLTAWAEILPQTFTLWLVNRFGDVFIIAEDGSVHQLDVSGGTLHRVADTREQFAELADIPQNANNWLMIPLVDQCVKSGMSLQTGQCYGFKIPPLLGGEYEPDNITPVDLAQNYAFLADIWAQTKDLPGGALVRLVVGSDPKSH
jgi:hypothetical protein